MSVAMERPSPKIMPPRVQLTDDEAARLPALLQANPDTPISFPRNGSNIERVLWVLAAYAADNALSVNLITWLIFDEGPNIAPETTRIAVGETIEAGWVIERNGFQLTSEGTAQAAKSAREA
jgi:hypothetical protein